MFTNRYVRTIILSRVFLQLGIWIRNFAVLLYVTEITNNDPHYVSLISVVEFGPIFLFAIIGGTFADRWKPKRTMVWSDLLSTVSVVAVIIALVMGHWVGLLLGTLVSASLSQFSQPSAMKLYKKHVPNEQLQSVMAFSQSLVAIFTIIGPVVGTFIFVQFGITVSLVLTLVFFMLSAIILSLLPRDAEEGKLQNSGSFLSEMKAGIQYMWANRSLRTLSATFAATGLASGMIQPLLIFITMEQLGQDKQFIQWLLMANGAAMLIGGIALMGMTKKVRPQVLLATGLLVSAICTVIVGASTSVVLSVTLQVISGLFYPCVQGGIQALIVRNTKAEFMGRVGGAITPVFMGMMVIGMSVSGYLKDLFSLFAVYAASGALLIIGVLLLTPLLRENRSKRREVSGLQ
ncbi:MFS transporter [Paenibacillus sp. H1-7]|uniref:MFS transporter n=1 Tax=Paenibacillus sp. H1-7 TaxID=2282849 RepID=UPI001EF81258|nr:MFS transporter [Paenibacillus sp. H1-7]ULL15666.1 MFS transporter [Paenibacillus sp. H1-7]